jgi:hypothetical protein
MNFTSEELKYLYHVLSTASSYTIARGEQIDHPTVNHKQLQQKIKEQIEKIHWK